MKKIVTLVFSVLMVASLYAGGSADKEQTVSLMQGKPEIDPTLQAYGTVWEEKSGIQLTVKSIGGSSAGIGQQLRADFAAGDMPDIFQIAGVEDFYEWEGIILDLSGEEWVKDTSVAFMNEGKVYGFPVAMEGWGLAYNADLLEKAGIDPATLNNYAAYKAAFEKLESMKSTLGIDSVVSMAASAEMGWVTAHHNFNSLLSNGEEFGDLSVTNEFKAGNVDAKRLSEYADWVELLFNYAEPSVLVTGNYDSQVGAFAEQKAVFLHQGNWVDPNMASANATFEMAYAPHGSMHAVTDGIFVSPSGYWVINAESDNVEAAKQFLKDLVYTAEGNNFMVNEAGMIPAFGNVDLEPTGQLSRSVQAWTGEGKVYSWDQYHFSGDFRDQVLAPVYNQFANGQISKAEFVELLTKAFEGLK